MRTRRRPAASPAPTPPAFDQAEARRRRRVYLAVTLPGEFDLKAEVADILEPLAERVAVDRMPGRYRDAVGALSDAVHVAVVGALMLVADRDDRARVQHLEVGARERALRLLREARTLPARPTFDADALESGRWAQTLVDFAASVSEPLSRLLSDAWPPGAVALRGQRSVSERLVDLLRGVDRAAADLERRLDRAPKIVSVRPVDAADRARAELRALGITPPG
ncbi:hypothetical protein [Nocardia puris]|uniref:hypothetical protein n=1 Tax=Nocardia puris TaxID=208602 RepID=UPI002E20FE2F